MKMAKKKTQKDEEKISWSLLWNTLEKFVTLQTLFAISGSVVTIFLLYIAIVKNWFTTSSLVPNWLMALVFIFLAVTLFYYEREKPNHKKHYKIKKVIDTNLDLFWQIKKPIKEWGTQDIHMLPSGYINEIITGPFDNQNNCCAPVIERGNHQKIALECPTCHRKTNIYSISEKVHSVPLPRTKPFLVLGMKRVVLLGLQQRYLQKNRRLRSKIKLKTLPYKLGYN